MTTTHLDLLPAGAGDLIVCGPFAREVIELLEANR